MLGLTDLLAATSGENVTEFVQYAPAARVAGQSFVWANHEAAVPVSPMLLTEMGAASRPRKPNGPGRAVRFERVGGSTPFPRTVELALALVGAAVCNHRVPLGDCFAKYAAASFEKSRSRGTFDSSRLRRAISSSRRMPLPGKALPPPAFASRTQRVSMFGLTPTSRAICRQLDYDRRTSSTSSRLYSGL
jgi:hypothetical protein